jgi:methylisocitrate lyase
MTEFGKSRLLTKKELENLGYNLVIYPLTTQRLAMFGVEKGLNAIKESGSADSVLDIMQTRSRLYDVLGYSQYNNFDENLYNFKLNKKQ